MSIPAEEPEAKMGAKNQVQYLSAKQHCHTNEFMASEFM